MTWVGVGALALGTAAAVLWASHRTVLHADVVLAERGAQELRLRCDACANGARVAHREAATSFSDSQARLPLEPALAPGPQSLSLSLTEDTAQVREFAVAVTVPCRLSPDLDGLALVPPSWGILVESHGGAAVVLDGRPVALDREGRGSVRFPVGPGLDGPREQRVRVERLVPFSVTVPGQAPLRGRFPLHVDVVPLQLEAPGESIVISSDSFMLAGKTYAGASVQVEDHSIVVDREGRFAQRMSVSSVGQRTITARARAPGLAPRSIAIGVRRVADLKEVLAGCPRLDASQLAESGESPAALAGRRVAVEGRVAALQPHGEATRITLEVPCGTRSCQVRVKFGAAAGAQVGDRIAACGTIASDGPLIAEFVTPVETEK